MHQFLEFNKSAESFIYIKIYSLSIIQLWWTCIRNQIQAHFTIYLADNWMDCQIQDKAFNSDIIERI